MRAANTFQTPIMNVFLNRLVVPSVFVPHAKSFVKYAESNNIPVKGNTWSKSDESYQRYVERFQFSVLVAAPPINHITDVLSAFNFQF